MGAPQDEEKSAAANTDALLAWLPLLAKAEELEVLEKEEVEPLRYASPPCYLAEFPDEDSTAHTTK
ncbi:hypothetical protein [Prosthecobacter sp.]|uniref:hypothetical protein n=1 Tax=Prosthecobacter sp. TaxID=1965333 RepID=UPI002489CB5F|nr:hypothetical protein [Prosthecobacter sp.]MDI1315344.1 hypothetical protein [Prosthecobacter sp.]